MPRKKPTPSSISRPRASIARPRPANSSTPPSLPRLTAWSPPRPWRPSRRANGAASPEHPPQIPGDLFDRLGLRRIRAARLGQQPDSLRFELRRVFRAFCHGSTSPIELEEMRNKKQVISVPCGHRVSSRIAYIPIGVTPYFVFNKTARAFKVPTSI